MIGSVLAEADDLFRINAGHEIGLSVQCKCKRGVGQIPTKNYVNSVGKVEFIKHVNLQMVSG